MGSTSNPKTRQESSNDLTSFVGTGNEFLISEVPKLRDVIRKGIILKEATPIARHLYTTAVLAKDLTTEILALWCKSSTQFKPPVILTEQYLVQKIKTKWREIIQAVSKKGSISEKKDLNLINSLI